jgi:spore germination protein GerM
VRRIVSLIGSLALISVLSGCSVATQNTATALPPSLTLPPTSTTSTTLPPSHATHQLEVYFIKQGRLFPVKEYYSSDPLDVALADLDTGPSAGDVNQGISTAFSEIPAAITSAGPVGKDGIAFIEVDEEFTSLTGVALLEAFAQIVYTVTGLPGGPAAVKFVYDASLRPALIPPGELVDRAVTRLDYSTFAPLT